MNLSLHYHKSIFLRDRDTLATSQLLGHDKRSKQYVLEAVDLLINYKLNVHEFTDEIIEFWSLPRRIMARYHFDDAEQLNEWLDNLT